jgi:stalled ribosome rescue protein Dom34
MSVAPRVLELVRAHGNVRTLSVYLDGSVTDFAERNSWRVGLVHEIARVRETIHRTSHAEREAFDACAKQLLSRLPLDDMMLGAPGWVGFACENGDVYTESLDTPAPLSVTWGKGLRIIPYVGATNPGTALVVIADQKRSTFYSLVGTELHELERHDSHAHVEVASHMGTTPRQGFHPGTRGEAQHDVTQREMREASARLLKETLRRLRLRAEEHEWVAIGGSDAAVARLAAALPESLAARTCIVTSLRASMSEADTRRLATEALAAVRSGSQQRLVCEVVEMAKEKGRAVFGAERIARELELGAVDLLVLSSAIPRERVQETEQLVRTALTEGAQVEVVRGAAAALLKVEAGGVAARLRFRASETAEPRAGAFAAAH